MGKKQHLCRGGYTDKEAERNILANSFKRFEDMQMLRHTKTLGVVRMDETVWKHLAEQDKGDIRDICIQKLEEYYHRIAH